jgi:hypothetical protein
MQESHRFKKKVLSWEEEASSLYTSGAVGASLRCDTGWSDQTGFQVRISEIAAYTIVFFFASFAVLGVFARTKNRKSSQNLLDIIACQLFICSVALLRIGKG